ncbi:MAG: Gldg family protein [Pseudomonadota bacterium]
MNASMKKRALFSGLGLLVIALLVAVLTQVVSMLPNVRLDLTEDDLYTVTDGTKRMLKGMEKPVKAELFFSAELAEGVPQIGNYAQRVQELLREYQRLSGGKLEFTLVDPEPFSGEEDRANELGLMSVPVIAGGPEIWFGLAVTGDNGKPEIIDFFRPDREETLEYDLSQVVWKASRKTAPKIALVSGLEVQGGFDFMSRQPSPPWASFAQLEQLYTVEALPPDFDAIKDDVSLLVLVHPGALPDKSVAAIDRYVRAGGATLVFVDPFAERAGGGMFGGAESSSDLPALFAAWGVQYDPNQVLGDASLAVPVASSEYGRPVPHVAINQFGPGEFPNQDPVTARLERLIMASSGVLKHAEGSASVFTPLVESSDQAMLLPAGSFAMLDDHTKLYEGFRPTGERYVLAARVTGKVAGVAPAKPGEPAMQAAVEEKPANILIVADTDVLSDRLWVRIQDFMGQQVASAFADNGDFAINAVDSLMGSADLMNIRGRGRYERPFEAVDSLERQAAIDLQAKEQELEAQLAETEDKLRALESKKQQDAKAFELDDAQVQELERFMAEKVRIRKELRDVQHQLGSDIESLGTVLRWLNIVVAPLLLVLVVFGVARWRLAAHQSAGRR